MPEPNPAGEAAIDRRFVIAVSCVLVLYSGVVQLVPGYNAFYVPISLAVAALLATAAHKVGLRRGDLGLEREMVPSGVAWGMAAAGVAAAVLAAGVAIPSLRPLFEDQRVAGLGPGLLAYRTLIRIPLGTALLEEFAFRGVLFGAWRRIAGPLQAAAGSSVIFGLWHLRPANDLLDLNNLALATDTRGTTLAAAVLGATVAGFIFCLLRIRSRSLLAPFIAHAAVNSMAIFAAYLVA